jgi:renalase
MKPGANQPNNVLIVGAGLAGLAAARKLADYGRAVTVIDKGRGGGGRLATRRIMKDGRTAILDHGAQFFTVRDPRFAAQVAAWQQDGAAHEWSRGFAAPGKPYMPDGHPRYIGSPGMTALAKHLARGLDVRTGIRAAAVSGYPDRWKVILEHGEALDAGALILTPPMPQSLALLDSGGVALECAQRAALQSLTYEPCIALLVTLKGPSRIPEPGGLQNPGNGIAWMADNQRKGISPEATGVTIHADADFSRQYWERDDETVQQTLLAAAQEWLGAPALLREVKRWRYAKPEAVYPEPCLMTHSRPPLILAGDIFGGPRVEGAFLSGWNAAEALL